jgi:hypothetical protein
MESTVPDEVDEIEETDDENLLPSQRWRERGQRSRRHNGSSSCLILGGLRCPYFVLTLI